jgi:hypothetical protein
LVLALQEVEAVDKGYGPGMLLRRKVLDRRVRVQGKKLGGEWEFFKLHHICIGSSSVFFITFLWKMT